MGTTSTYFGGSGGGGGNIGSSSLGTFFPLDTELPLYMPYRVVNTNGTPLDTWAGNPLGNGYCCKHVNTTQFRIADTTQTVILNVAPANINASAVRIGGCLLYTSPSPRDGLLSRMPSSA